MDDISRLMQNQNMNHSTVQEKEFDYRLNAWQEILPLYFAANQVNYARYRSYYVEMLKNLDQFHNGLRKLLLKKEVTAQAQEKYPCRTRGNKVQIEMLKQQVNLHNSFFFYFLRPKPCIFKR